MTVKVIARMLKTKRNDDSIDALLTGSAHPVPEIRVTDKREISTYIDCSCSGGCPLPQEIWDHSKVQQFYDGRQERKIGLS
jgi:hypothetical protein